MKRIIVKFITMALVAIMLISVCMGCNSEKNPKNYYLNDSTALPEGITAGNYNLDSLKYRNPQDTTLYAEYFDRYKDSEVVINEELFRMGETTFHSPKYHEMQFNGYIPGIVNIKYRYRPLKSGEGGDFVLDESAHEAKRCIAVFDSADVDTGYRIFIMDGKIWLGYFFESQNSWICRDIFIIKRRKI